MINYRQSVIHALIPGDTQHLLDVGCGPIFPDYVYADRANSVLCVDWNLVKVGNPPSHVKCISGDFVNLELPRGAFDVIIAADVFEHVQLEHEALFIDKCLSALRPNGRLILSVPHRGTFAWLDPYEIKPLRDRARAKFGLLKKVHNGSCDIRKGHKHYLLGEITHQFAPLQVEKVVYWGYFYDPLLSWAYAILGETSTSPVIRFLERRVGAEFEEDHGVRSFNMAVVLAKIDEIPSKSSL